MLPWVQFNGKSLLNTGLHMKCFTKQHPVLTYINDSVI